MIKEGKPGEVDFGPDDCDFDPPDCPEVDEEFEPWEEPIDRDSLVYMVMSLDTTYSIAQIEFLLQEPKIILKSVDKKTIDRLEDLASENLLRYPFTCEKLRDDIRDCAADDPRNVPWLQFLALHHTDNFFNDFRTIGCYSEVKFEQFIWSFANANWWAARWHELVREYGDRTLDFLI